MLLDAFKPRRGGAASGVKMVSTCHPAKYRSAGATSDLAAASRWSHPKFELRRRQNIKSAEISLNWAKPPEVTAAVNVALGRRNLAARVTENDLAVLAGATQCGCALSVVPNSDCEFQTTGTRAPVRAHS